MDCIIEITASSFLSDQQVVHFLFHLKNIKEENMRQDWSAQRLMPQLESALQDREKLCDLLHSFAFTLFRSFLSHLDAKA